MSFSALLVDDSPDDRALAARELVRHFPDVRIVEAGSPETLAAALDQDGFDIAITDCWGHVHDGDRPQRAGFDVREPCRRRRVLYRHWQRLTAGITTVGKLPGSNKPKR